MLLLLADQQTFARTKVVFEGALEGYKQIVDTWFSRLAPRLQTYVTLPARLVGFVKPQRPDLGFQGAPGIYWYLEPLQRIGSKSFVDLHLTSEVKTSTIPSEFELDRLYSLLCSLRPEAATWISAWLRWGILDIFHSTPITKLVYKWLWDDLNQIFRFKGLL